MSKRMLLFFSVVLSIVFSTACMEKVPLVVTNGLENCNITCVYISRNSDNVWGTNHLPGSDVVTPGEEAEVAVRPGVYDLQIIDDNGDTYTLEDIRVGAGGFNWTVTMADMDAVSTSLQYAGHCPVSITSQLDKQVVNGIWIAPSDSDGWGENHLGDEVLYTGDTYTAFMRSDTYDIYLQDQSGNTYSRFSVEVVESGYNWRVSKHDMD